MIMIPLKMLTSRPPSNSSSARPVPRRRRACLSLLLLLAGPTLHAAPAAPVPAPLPVVASFSILGDLVKQVGGDRVAVEVLVGPGSDAHVVQPTPAQARSVASAQLIFSNGLGFEGWMARFLKAAGFKGRHVVLAEGLGGQGAPTASKDRGHEASPDPRRPSGHSHAHAHAHDVDPHVWQDVRQVLKFTRRIADALCEVDADGCSGYRQRSRAYAERLDALHREIVAGWAAIPAARRKVITSHEAFGHYGAAYGVTFLAPLGVSTQAEPSAQGVAALVRQIRREGVRALFVENVTDPRLIEQIARETGLQTSGSLYSDSLSDTQGPAPTYEAMMRINTQRLLQAVGRP